MVISLHTYTTYCIVQIKIVSSKHTWCVGCGATIPACGLRVARASLAAVTSLVRRAITRHAASC